MKALLAKRCLFHPTYYDAYYLSVLGDSPLVLTVHDMIHEKFPCYFSLKDIIEKTRSYSNLGLLDIDIHYYLENKLMHSSFHIYSYIYRAIRGL